MSQVNDAPFRSCSVQTASPAPDPRPTQPAFNMLCYLPVIAGLILHRSMATSQAHHHVHEAVGISAHSASMIARAHNHEYVTKVVVLSTGRSGSTLAQELIAADDERSFAVVEPYFTYEVLHREHSDAMQRLDMRPPLPKHYLSCLHGQRREVQNVLLDLRMQQIRQNKTLL